MLDLQPAFAEFAFTCGGATGWYILGLQPMRFHKS